MDLRYTCGHCSPVARNSLHLGRGRERKRKNFIQKLLVPNLVPIGHFLVHLGLHFKARLSAKSYENQFSFILKLEPITIRKISHLDFERETERNSEMAYYSIYFSYATKCGYFYLFSVNLEYFLKL